LEQGREILMKKLKPRACLACVLHSRTPLKTLLPPLLDTYHKAKERGLDGDNWEEVDRLADELNRKLGDLNINRCEDLDGELGNGIWDVYYDNEEDWYYTQEIK